MPIFKINWPAAAKIIGINIRTNLIHYDSIMIMSTCLVSGGAGFIGSHLCKSLIKDGYKVICLDNLLTGSKNNVEELIEDSNFLLVNADVTKKLPELITDTKIEYIFHLASP